MADNLGLARRLDALEQRVKEVEAENKKLAERLKELAGARNEKYKNEKTSFGSRK